MPKQAVAFLLETPLNSLTLYGYAKFWLSPMVVDYTRSVRLAGTVRDASFSIALNYLMLGKVQEARALTLNGSFILGCMDTPIETIVEWCRKDIMPAVQLFSHVLDSVKTPQAMEAFLQRMIRMFDNVHKNDVVEHVGQTGDNCSGHSTRRHQKPSSKTSSGTQIQLILVDDSNEDERQTLNIGSSTTLKTLFNDYAEKRGVSLRSLRFVYDNKTLFLSSVGNKTPDELNMGDQDVITVRGTNNVSQETSNSRPTTPEQAKKINNSTKKKKGKGKKEQSKQKAPIKTLEEYKAYHSTILSKLHEEVQLRLKEIRTRLNGLDLERQPPKQKRKSKRKKKNQENVDPQIMLPNSGVGGKAGKPYFIVQVGEVQNLYKTTKPSVLSSQHSPCSAYTLDLHGYTRKEALIKLDESLEVWVDTAMKGSYPFVIPAMIVCGCGSQVLSETVEKWIKSTRNVCNAPKNSTPRNKFSHAVQ